MEVTSITARRRQQRISESFEASIRETWPYELVEQAKKAIQEHDYRALDAILARLHYYS
ncbi:MAG: hypothetical protein ABIS59_02490 [Candidatus Saccharibacteria bacterium]